MKLSTINYPLSTLLLLFCLSVQTYGDGTPAAPATQAEVNAGVSRSKYVTPFTLASSTVGKAQYNGIAYPNLNMAVVAASAGVGMGLTGQVVYVTGTMDITNTVIGSNAVVIRGLGDAWIRNFCTNDAVIPIGICLYDGMTLDGLSMTNMYTNLNSGQVCWGTVDSTWPAITNWTVKNCKGYGSSDVLYIRHTNGCPGGRYENNYSWGNWDVGFLSAAMTPQTVFTNNVWWVEGSAGFDTAISVPRGVYVSSGNMSFNNDRFYGNGNDCTNVVYVSGNGSTYAYPSLAMFNNCTFTMNVTNNTQVAIRHIGGPMMDVVLNGGSVVVPSGGILKAAILDTHSTTTNNIWIQGGFSFPAGITNFNLGNAGSGSKILIYTNLTPYNGALVTYGNATQTNRFTLGTIQTNTVNTLNAYVVDTMYTNSGRSGTIQGSAVLNAVVAGSANITLLYTNNGTGYAVPMQIGSGAIQTGNLPFSALLGPGSTFKFLSTMGGTASGYITNTVIVTQ